MERQRAVSWPVLAVGMLLTAVAALSVHVVMLEVLMVPYPQDAAAGRFPRFLSYGCSVAATLAVYRLAKPRLARFSLPLRCLILTALYCMLRELLIRAAVMDGVVTTAWTFSALTHLPRLIGLLVACSAIVIAGDRLSRLWQLAAAAVAIAAAYMFGVQPLIDRGFRADSERTLLPRA